MTQTLRAYVEDKAKSTRHFSLERRCARKLRRVQRPVSNRKHPAPAQENRVRRNQPVGGTDLKCFRAKNVAQARSASTRTLTVPAMPPSVHHQVQESGKPHEQQENDPRPILPNLMRASGNL
jgi:hypothetical protein